MFICTEAKVKQNFGFLIVPKHDPGNIDRGPRNNGSVNSPQWEHTMRHLASSLSLLLMCPHAGIRAQDIKFTPSDLKQPLLIRASPADAKLVARNQIGDPNRVFIRKPLSTADAFKALKLPLEERLEAFKKANEKSSIVFEGHEKMVLTLAWSPDGKYLITGAADNTARIWESATGKQLALLELDSPVALAVFTSDGKTAITGPGAMNGSDIHVALAKETPINSSGMVILWDTKGKKIKELDGGQKEILQAVVSPKTDLIACAGRNNTVCLWNVAKRELVHTFTKLDAPLVQIRFTPDGKLLLGAGYEEKRVRVFDPAGKQERAALEGMKEPVRSFIISGDGKHVLASSQLKYSTPLDEKNAFERTVVGLSSLGISEVVNVFQAKSETNTCLWKLSTRELRFQGPGKDFDYRQLSQFGFDFYELFNAGR